MKIKFTPRFRVFLRFYLFWLLAALALYYSVLVIRNSDAYDSISDDAENPRQY